MPVSVLGHHGLFQALCQPVTVWFSFGFVQNNDMKSKKKKKKENEQKHRKIN